MFAKRTDWILSPNEIAQTINDLRQKNTALLDLTESNPTRCCLPLVTDRILQELSRQDNGKYAPSPKGDLFARQAIADYYLEHQLPVDPERIFLTASTSEAYSFLFRLLLNTEESVLFPRPSYPLFDYLADLNDIHLKTYPLSVNDEWRIDHEIFKSDRMDEMKAVVVVNPNNPTGSFVHPEDWSIIKSACTKRGIPLICDEVFVDYSIKEAPGNPSLAGSQDVLTCVLGGLSKTLGLPQMKVSWIILNGPEQQVEDASERLEVITDTFLSVNTPAQHALPGWLRMHREVQSGIIERIRQNYRILQEGLTRDKLLNLFPVQGGWNAVLSLPPALREDPFVRELLVQDHVIVHPGYFFDFPLEGCIVISLLPTSEVFQAGLERMMKRAMQHC